MRVMRGRVRDHSWYKPTLYTRSIAKITYGYYFCDADAIKSQTDERNPSELRDAPIELKCPLFSCYRKLSISFSYGCF